jgi:hypothetical protein
MDDLSKDAQLARSPGGNRTCPTTGELKRSCSCYSCVGSRNRRKGKRKQRETRKVLEREFGTAGPTQTVTSHEENWRMRVRLEVKSGKQVESLTKRFLTAEAQSNASKAEGDTRPFVFAAAPDGTSDQIIAFRLSQREAVIGAACPNPCCR